MDFPILIGLVNNAALLLVIGLLYDVLECRLGATKYQFLRQIVTGSILGLIGIALIFNSFDYGQGVIFDTRSVLLSLSGFFFGLVPVLVAVLVTGTFRLLIDGAGDLPGLFVIVFSGAIGLIWRQLRRTKEKDPSGSELYVLGIVVHVVMLACMLLLPWQIALAVLSRISLPVLLIYPIATVLLGKLLVNHGRRKLFEETLRNNLEKTSSIIETSRDWIWAIDSEGNHTYCSPAVTSILGYAPEEFMGKSSIGFIHPEDRKGVQSQLAEWIHSKSGWQNLTLRWRHKDGGWRYLESNAVAILDRYGNLSGFRGVDRDITSRIQAEEELHTSQRIIEGIISSLPARVFWKDMNLVYLGCNQAFARDAGFADPKDVIGKNDYQLSWCNQAELYRKDDRLVIESGCAKNLVEEPQTTPEGKIITLLTSKLPLRNSEGELCGVLGTYMDITEIKHTEEVLRREKEKAEVYLNLAGTFILALDSQGIVTMINGKGCQILGYDKEDILGKNWFDNFIPQRTVSSVENVFRQLILGKVKIVEFFENPVQTKRGEERLVVWHNTVIFNDEDEISGILSSGDDITDRRKAEIEKTNLKSNTTKPKRWNPSAAWPVVLLTI